MSNPNAEVTLELEGRVAADWVPLLEKECRRSLDARQGVRLDFSHVTYVDPTGAELVRRLVGEGVRIVNCPEAIRDLLGGGRQPWGSCLPQ